MIKALIMLFLVITRIPIMNIKNIVFKYRIKKIYRLCKIGYLDEKQAITIIERLRDKFDESDKLFEETVIEYLKKEGR